MYMHAMYSICMYCVPGIVGVIPLLHVGGVSSSILGHVELGVWVCPTHLEHGRIM